MNENKLYKDDSFEDTVYYNRKLLSLTLEVIEYPMKTIIIQKPQNPQSKFKEKRLFKNLFKNRLIWIVLILFQWTKFFEQNSFYEMGSDTVEIHSLSMVKVEMHPNPISLNEFCWKISKIKMMWFLKRLFTLSLCLHLWNILNESSDPHSISFPAFSPNWKVK